MVPGYYWCNNVLLINFLSPPVVEAVKRLLGYDSEMLLQFFYLLPFDPFQPVYIDILLVIQTYQGKILYLPTLKIRYFLFVFVIWNKNNHMFFLMKQLGKFTKTYCM